MATESKSDGASMSMPEPGSLEARIPILGERNPRNIPKMEFIDDVGALIESSGVQVEDVLTLLNTMHGKYKMMTSHLSLSKTDAEKKLPGIEASLAVIDRLKAKQDAGESLKTQFSISDNVYAKAIVDPCDRVMLWQGAGVFVEYSYAEAEKLLQANLEGAKDKIATLQEDLDFLKDAMTTTEVNMARTFNHDVKVRRLAKEAESKK